MQRILLITDARNLNAGTLECASYLAQNTNAALAGIFLEEFRYKPVPEIKNVYGFPVVEEITADAEQTEAQKKEIDANIERFIYHCDQKHIRNEICKETGKPLEEVIEESRYADLIVLDPTISFRNHKEKLPTKFVKQILHAAECPVIIAPENFDPVREIVLCYDGSKSSVFAIKWFTYLLGSFGNKRTTLLHIAENESDGIIGFERMKQWLSVHYADLTVETLFGNAGDTLFKKFWSQSDKLIVMGAYGRDSISTFLEPSTATLLLEAVDTPIFITHR